MADEENQLFPNRGTRLFLGDPEAEAAAAASKAMEPIVGPWLKGAVTGQHAADKFKEMFPPTPDQKPDESAVEYFRRLTRNPETGRVEISPTAWDLGGAFVGNFKAYHGSKAKFGAFDDAYMSSGEGGQMFSWGHYTGGHPGTGEAYQKSVGGYNKTIAHPDTGDPLTGVDLAREVFKPGHIIPDQWGHYHKVDKFWEPKDPDGAWSVDTTQVNLNTDRVIKAVKEGRHDDVTRQYTGLEHGDLWDDIGGQKKRANLYSDEIEAVAKARGLKLRDPGYFYDVWVKPEHNEFLDWFLPFSKQEKGVQDKLKAMKADPESIWKEMNGQGPAPDLDGKTLYNTLVQKQQAVWPHNQPRDIDEMRRLASKKLDAGGIPGTRFWDERSRHLPENVVDHPGELPKFLTRNSGLLDWFAKQMNNSSGYADILRRVESRYNKEHSNIANNAVTRGMEPGSQEFIDYITKQHKPYDDLYRFVKDNPGNFVEKPNPTQRTHNYVLYDPQHLEITHRDGRQLIPVEDNPTFPEKYRAYKKGWRP